MTIKDFGPGFSEFVLADAAIAAVVGDRLFPEVVPEGVRAASIVYTLVSENQSYTMKARSSLVNPRYQIDCWAPERDDALALANLVKERIDGYRGVMGTGGNAVTIRGIFQVNDRINFDDTVQMSGVSRDYDVWLSET